MELPHLSQYVDYRKYLAHFYAFKVHESKGQRRPFSYGDFSAAADIKSPNYLKLIIEGKRNLSQSMVRRFSRALRHDASQTKEFSLLVSYGQEKDPLARTGHLKALSEYRAKKALEKGELNPEAWNRVSNWLVWVLYAMVDQKNIQFTPAHLQKALGNQANETQIQQALHQLLSSQDIEIHPQTAQARRTGSKMSGLDNIPKDLVRKIQSELIYLGLESLHKNSPQEREISGFTLAMTEKEYQWVRFELRKLRKQIQKDISMNREQGPGDRVYQVNMQLFPVSDQMDERKQIKREGQKETREDHQKNPLRP